MYYLNNIDDGFKVIERRKVLCRILQMKSRAASFFFFKENF